MDEQFDMFGNPVRPGKGMRGKPPHERTVENVNNVNRLLAFGWNNERIAGAMRISLPTLRKYYFAELKVRQTARDALEMTIAAKLWAGVEAGNVGAIKQYQALIERNDRMKFAQGIGKDEALKVEPVKVSGKKDLAVQRAERALRADPDLAPGLLRH